MGYSFRSAARDLLYAQFHGQFSTYHDLCSISRGTLPGPRNSSMDRTMSGRSITENEKKKKISCTKLIYVRKIVWLGSKKIYLFWFTVRYIHDTFHELDNCLHMGRFGSGLSLSLCNSFWNFKCLDAFCPLDSSTWKGILLHLSQNLGGSFIRDGIYSVKE